MLVLIISYHLIMIDGTGNIQENAPRAVDDKLVQYLWSGFRNGREKLRSGVYRARGRMLEVDPDGKRHEGDVEFFGAFDDKAGLKRFDRSEPEFPRERPKDLPASVRIVPSDRFGGKLIMTPTKNIFWDDNPSSSQAWISEPGPINTPIDPFDVNRLGLLFFIGSDSSPDLDFEAALKDWMAIKVVEVVREPGGLIRLTGLFGINDLGKREIWLDETKDFAPMRSEIYRLWNAKLARKPVFSSELTWTKISGTWVPKTFRNVKDNGSVISYDLAFDWQSVNEPVSTELFDVHGMNLPKGTFVNESRINKNHNYVLEVIGRPDYPLLPPPTQSKPARRSLHAPVLAAVGGIAAVAGAALFLAQRRGRRRNSLDAG